MVSRPLVVDPDLGRSFITPRPWERKNFEPDALSRRNFRFLSPHTQALRMALSLLSSHTVHRWNSLRVLGGSRSRVSSMDGHALPGRLPELSNFYCLPARAGGSPLAISTGGGPTPDKPNVTLEP